MSAEESIKLQLSHRPFGYTSCLAVYITDAVYITRSIFWPDNLGCFASDFALFLRTI